MSTTQTPSVTTFGETSALYALMEGDREGARRICADMNRSEREEFTLRLRDLREILEGLNARRCVNCRERVAKVPPLAIKGGSPHQNIWFHTSSHGTACSTGNTLAEPESLED